MSDVDVPRTWSLPNQGYFWSGSGPAAAIKGRYTIPIFGAEVKWRDAEAREYWGGIVGDPSFNYPQSSGIGPAGPGDEESYPPPLASNEYPIGTATGDERRFCSNCGAPNMGSRFCPQCGTALF